MTRVYVVQPDDYDSNPPSGVYTSIKSALSCSISVEQHDLSDDGLNIYCYMADEDIAVWADEDDNEFEQTGLKYVDRRIAHVSFVNKIIDGKLPEPTIVVKINNNHCTELNLNPVILVGDAAKVHGFQISKITADDEVVIFELTKGAK